MWFKSLFRFNTISRTLYQSQNIPERISTFQKIDLAKQQVTPQSISNPSFLTEAKAKDILQFVRVNQIPNNVRILHALAHIQYNAFMSYVDTLFRFKNETATLQEEFVSDMRMIAIEEGSHFILLQNRLLELGYSYGCMPVIPKLSHAIKCTEENLIQRIGVISLMHEGRGVKAVEKLLYQLAQAEDHGSVLVVKIIQNDEHRHFEMGWKWFIKICGIKQLSIQQQIDNINQKFKSNIALPAKQKLK